MYINDIKQNLKVLLQMEEPVAIMLWGKPGIGKSAAISQVAKELGNWSVIDLRLLTKNPVDLSGIPVPNREKKIVEWLPAGFLPYEERDGKNGILLLDEITAAPPALQAVAYQLTLDRKAGEYTLPDGWRVVCAGNSITDRGVAYNMPSPLANRLIHIEAECDLNDWKTWAIGKINSKIISFLNYRPELLYKFPSDAQEIKAFPTPRTWEFTSRIFTAYNEDIDKARDLIDGTIGKGAAIELSAFIKIYKDLPDIEKILNGQAVTIDQKPDILYALAGALTTHITQNPSTDRIRNYFSFIEDQMPTEFQVLTVKDTLKDVKALPALLTHPSYQNWAAKNASSLI